MTDDELYDLAVREYQGRNWQGWLTAQSDQTLLRLYAGLSQAKAHTLVVRTPDERAAAEAHTGRVVIRDEQRLDDMYAWDDYCTDCCVLEDVTQTLGKRLYARVTGSQDCLAVALEALPGDGLRVDELPSRHLPPRRVVGEVCHPERGDARGVGHAAAEADGNATDGRG